MRPHEAAALDAIEGVYGESVAFTGAGLNGGTIVAVHSDRRGAPFEGLGETVREVSFEIDQQLLPLDPRKGNLIVQADGRRWRVIEPRRRDDIARWELVVEEAPDA